MSVVLGHYECEDCGHQQTTEITHAAFATLDEYGTAGVVLESGYVGSAADFCDMCGGEVRWLAVEADGVLYDVDEED